MYYNNFENRIFSLEFFPKLYIYIYIGLDYWKNSFEGIIFHWHFLLVHSFSVLVFLDKSIANELNFYTTYYGDESSFYG